ncbi:hypothetical protein ACHY48_20675 [Pantoea agglomerans]|uniref:hypothetical protein n=1 Tax=Enterobacter agglomerans TaxID=549 RepID=UPI00387F026F
MNLTTHTELHEKWMRDEIYIKEYEAELRREDACASAEITNEIKPNREGRKASQ